MLFAATIVACDESSSSPPPLADASTQDSAPPPGRDASAPAGATTPDSSAGTDSGPVVRPRGPLEGTFLSFDSGAITSGLVPAQLDELVALGMDTVIVASSRSKSGSCAVPSRLPVFLFNLRSGAWAGRCRRDCPTPLEFRRAGT